MKKVTSSDSLITIGHYKNLLIAEGIPAFIKNEYLSGVLGEVPFQDTWPELWIHNDLDYDRAVQLLDMEKTLAESPRAAWRCEVCGAENEGQFGACWSCSRPRRD